MRHSSLHHCLASAAERAMDVLPVLLGVAVAILFLLLVGCSGEPPADAYGNFEATDVTVSAQSEGRLVAFRVDEGDVLGTGEQVGSVDTTQLAAQREGLLAQRANLLAQRRALLVQQGATRAQLGEIEAGVGVIAAQLETAEEEWARTKRLYADSAATARELNEREGVVLQLRQQLEQARARGTSIAAQADVPGAQASAVDGQVAAVDAQLRQVADRIAKAAVMNPTAGTVLSVLAREGENVMPGSPLYTIADMSTLRLRAYATGNQLAAMRVGEQVDVLVDDPNGGLSRIPGVITWVSSGAEFTPTPIQTRDERADLVYAFTVRVPNPDGRLKIGMPGEVRFMRDATE